MLDASGVVEGPPFGEIYGQGVGHSLRRSWVILRHVRTTAFVPFSGLGDGEVRRRRVRGFISVAAEARNFPSLSKLFDGIGGTNFFGVA